MKKDDLIDNIAFERRADVYQDVTWCPHWNVQFPKGDNENVTLPQNQYRSKVENSGSVGLSGKAFSLARRAN
ncbi:hypothetical protein SAMN05216411_1221, partial [Nitrosospira multiformis]